jgi:hypothetical protein
MKRRVYRSLDRPATVFGIRGRFLWVMALGGALALIIGMVVGSVTSMIVGFGAGLLAVTGAYFVTVSLQSRIDERDIWKMVVRQGFPALYRMKPKHIRNLWKGINLEVEKSKEN